MLTLTRSGVRPTLRASAPCSIFDRQVLGYYDSVVDAATPVTSGAAVGFSWPGMLRPSRTSPQ